MKRFLCLLGTIPPFLCSCFFFDSGPDNFEEITQSEHECWKRFAHYADLAATDIDINPMLSASLHTRTETLQTLVEHSLVYREKMIHAYEEFKKRDQDSPVSGKWLDTLKTGAKGYTDLRNTIYIAAERYECLIDLKDTLLAEAEVDSKLRLKAVMLSLAASLTLYDNYLLAVAVLQEDEEISRILNEQDSGFNLEENELLKITRSASHPGKRNRIRTAQKYYERRLAQLGENAFPGDNDFHYLNLLIEQSASYKYVKNFRSRTIFRENFKWLGRLSKGVLEDLGIDSVDFVSKVFGNGVGSIQFGLGQLGKLYGNDGVAKDLKTKLRAGDILVEKTPFRLTDKFIPGHWGHVAIWIGTKTELQHYGLWDDPIWEDIGNHPELAVYKKRIEAADKSETAGFDNELNENSEPLYKDGPLVAEALRSGVRLSTLHHFMNVDDIAILRPKAELTYDETRGILYRALQQIGKDYDFNFDVETLDKIVCSELAYQTYHSIDWETEDIAGRFTISPDHVAKKAFDETLELVTFFHDGKRIEKNTQLELMARLMNRSTK